MKKVLSHDTIAALALFVCSLHAMERHPIDTETLYARMPEKGTLVALNPNFSNENGDIECLIFKSDGIHHTYLGGFVMPSSEKQFFQNGTQLNIKTNNRPDKVITVVSWDSVKQRTDKQ